MLSVENGIVLLVIIHVVLFDKVISEEINAKEVLFQKFREVDGPYLFVRFINMYNKQYNDPEEYSKRYRLFMNTLMEINKINENHNVKVAPNFYADFTDEEKEEARKKMYPEAGAKEKAAHAAVASKALDPSARNSDPKKPIARSGPDGTPGIEEIKIDSLPSKDVANIELDEDGPTTPGVEEIKIENLPQSKNIFANIDFE